MSYNIQRKQLQSPLSASYAETASYALTFTETDPIFVAKSASLATTGSNIFIGNQTITGSILMSGSSADAYISTVNWIDFNTNIPAGSPTFASGRLHWVSDTQTLGLDTDVNGSSIELGHQHVVRVNNQTGTLLTVGTIVYINGSQGTRPTVATASYTDENDSATTLGFVMHDIAGTGGNRNGYIVTKGILRGVNTIGMPAGTSLYLSSSGKYSTSKPQAPLHDVRLGKVVYQGNNATDGVIYVDIQNGYEIEELHDVRIINASNGDLLTRSGSLWINTKQLSGFYGLTGSLSFRNGGVTGSLFGTASWATNAITSSVVSVASTSTAGTYYLHFGNQNSGVDNIEVDTGLTYNPSTNELSTTTFIGDLNGNAATSTTAGAAASAGNADNVTVNAFNAVDANTTHYFILENGVEGAASSEQLFENPLFSYLKSNNSYLFDDTEDKTAPKITIGAQDSVDKADVLVYGNVTATGIISAPNLSTGINTLNFVGDYTRPEETVSASFSVTDGRLLVSSASLSASFIGNLTGTASYATNALTASYLDNYIPPFPYTGNAQITGSLTITQNLTVLGSSSIVYVTSSQLDVGTNTISVNVAEPGLRFGGLVVYDSGSLSHQATASLFWDSLNNHWVYQNASGSTYSGGGFISGPKNFGALGSETYPTLNRIVKGEGGDHITDSNISDNGSVVSINSNTQVTGSLTVTQGVTGSLYGTASSATNALTASFIPTLRATGSNLEIQYNNNGNLGSDSAFTWNGDYLLLGVGDGGYIGNAGLVNVDDIGFFNGGDAPIAVFNPAGKYHYSNNKYIYDENQALHIFTGSISLEDNSRIVSPNTLTINSENFYLRNSSNTGFSIATISTGDAASFELGIDTKGSVRVFTTQSAVGRLESDALYVGQTGTPTNAFFKVVANTLSMSGSMSITGSLNVPAITGSLFGTSSWAVSSSQTLTASYVDPTFISSSAAASGFGSGGGGVSPSLAIAYAIALG